MLFILYALLTVLVFYGYFPAYSPYGASAGGRLRGGRRMEQHEMSFVSAAHVIKARGRGRRRLPPPPGFAAIRPRPRGRSGRARMAGGEKWDKIRLENFIFYLAARRKMPVRAWRGHLYCGSGTGALGALLRVYNRFFGKQNKRFLREEAKLEEAEYADFCRCYERERKANPLFPSFRIGTEREKMCLRISREK